MMSEKWDAESRMYAERAGCLPYLTYAGHGELGSYFAAMSW
jgi:hypothetical protein